ncbi:hypothetical protein EYF80_061391 [Liparis tanakae]|uniref:Uncharacterized protein n=1 Tax=Liparis tanakae TaxID=230148 RepID=A0A4Z2EIL7_9TELE|nr:hypothetical protein EYF80_061391 [Liparis tanakae]
MTPVLGGRSQLRSHEREEEDVSVQTPPEEEEEEEEEGLQRVTRVTTLINVLHVVRQQVLVTSDLCLRPPAAGLSSGSS